MARTVHVVPHTHWDREWYRTFQSFRMELVDLVDETLELLETKPEFTCFMLDGQMAVVDDYLDIRPENRERLETLARSGRLIMGPWYILMDEFLVSGETIVRDLQLGLTRAEAFGGAMPVGYLPDMFGHIAQMPQILSQFGFDHTVVWRGVPLEMTDRASFSWQAPDGSSVTAQYLPRGYGNGVGLPPSASDLVERVSLFTAQTGNRSGSGEDPILWMHGTDHRHPMPGLPDMISAANAAQDDFTFVVSSLPVYIAEQTVSNPPSTRWRGELRSGARANLLMGVTSNRVDVKQAAARAERTLERIAEPLSALLLPPSKWPAAFLDEAWRLMIQNSAHDSICACSHDDVVEAVRSRFAEATAIGEGLIERALLGAVSLAPVEDHNGSRPLALVVNPTARTRSGLITLKIPAGHPVEGMQVLRERPSRVLMQELSPQAAVDWMDVAEDHLGEVDRIDVSLTDDGAIDIELHNNPVRFGLLDATEPRRRLEALIEDNPDAPVHLWMGTTPGAKVLAHARDVPGFGISTWSPTPITVGPVTVSGTTMRNDLVTVTVADDGTYSVNDVSGLGRLVDDGDKGDTYNWCPPANDTVVSTPLHVSAAVLETGPLRARIQITAQYQWPERVDGETRIGDAATVVTTTLELQAGQDFVHVDVGFDNHSRDHRLRAWFPLPAPATTSSAECAFGIVERGLDAEGGPTEMGIATQPSRRFVSAGGLTIAHEGLLEYELVDIKGDGDSEQAHALAVTLLRATGLLSQAPMATRALPAGPIVPLDGPQLQGPQTARYVVHVGNRNPYELVDDAFVPLLTTGTARRSEVDVVFGESAPVGPPAVGTSLLEVTGAEVSALRRVPGTPDILELRVFNPTNEPVTVTVTGRTGSLVDLRGVASSPFGGDFVLRPWGMQTLHLDG